MKKEYFKNIKEVIEKSSKRASSVLDINSNERLNYLKFKSAFNYLYPIIKGSKNDYREYLINKELTSLEINYIHLLEKNGFSSHNGIKDLGDTPNIFCSFHMGSYISVCYYLVKNNITFSIVMGEESFNEKKEMFLFAYKKTLSVLKNSTSKIDFINGEKKNSIISMIKSTRKGKSLLFYIDGNKGVKEFDNNDDNLVEIDFLNVSIYSRKGISYLSNYLKINIIPIISYRESHNKIKVNFLDPISYEGNDREKYCLETTQKIWSQFLVYFKKYPLQCESIYYINQFRKPYFQKKDKGFNIKDIFRFNSNRYEFYQLDKKIIYDKYNGLSKKLSDGYSDFLYKIHQKNIELLGSDLMAIINNKAIITTLVENEYLIKNN